MIAKKKITKVCFVSLYAYPCVHPESRLPFGGSEVRAAIFAKELAALPDYDISLVVRNHDNRSMETLNQLSVYRHTFHPARPTLTDRLHTHLHSCRASSHSLHRRPWRLPKYMAAYGAWMAARTVRRFRHSMTPKLLKSVAIEETTLEPERIRIYLEVNADVYCAFGVNEVSGEVAAFCKSFGKKCLLFCGSDYDLSPIYCPGSTQRSIYGCRGNIAHHAIAASDHVITQSQHQESALWNRYRKRSTIIANPITLDNSINILAERKFALWIGKSDLDVKRPLLALDLARRLPAVPFVMVMSKRDQTVYETVCREAPGNVTLIDYVPLHEIDSLFAGAFALVSTSAFEGFPNTFLQAGKYAVPIVSLNVNPDGFIDRNQCGYVTGNMNGLANAIASLHENPLWRRELGLNCRRYVERRHDAAKSVCKLQSIIDTLMSSPSRLHGDGTANAAAPPRLCFSA